MPAVHSAQLEDLLTGIDRMTSKTITIKTGDSTTEKPNPEYFRWVTHD
jgi:hypothetical protein